MNDQQFCKLLDKTPANLNIQKYLTVTRHKLSEYRRVAVSYSGGSDSDIMLDLIELVKPEDCGEIRYIFFDTGLEWDATLRHLKETEQRYNVTIEQIKSKLSIPAACSKHGIPFISKDISSKINNLLGMEFDFSETRTFFVNEYKWAVDWFYDTLPLSKNGKKRQTISSERPLLRKFMSLYPPDFSISDKCCDYVKKNVSRDFDKEFIPDLRINGMRKAEGGRRAGSIKNCFTPQSEKKTIADYRPLWFWSDEEKQIYKEWREIQYSECYEKWGFARTGCVGCPCSHRAAQDLKIAEPFEPNKVKAAYAVFGKSYEYRELFNKFKEKVRAEAKEAKRESQCSF